jgi:enoyl-CoA hydratase
VGEFIRLDISDGIGTIRLDRPPMNALNVQVQEELREAAKQATTSDEIKAIIVYGGQKVFAAGADIKEMAGMGYAAMAARATELTSAFDALARVPKPTVAAITGYALGGGCELALACDWRVAAADAKLGQPEINLGIIPGAGGTHRLSRLVGPAKAKDIIMTGRFVDAGEALSIGLVDRVVSDGSARSRAVGLAGELAALPQACLRNDRLSAIEQWGLPEPEAMANEFRRGLATLASGETVAGAGRFADGEGRHGGTLGPAAAPE